MQAREIVAGVRGKLYRLANRLVRAGAVACEAMEKERGIEDGLTEMICDFADGAEFECYGPVGLRGTE